MINGGKKLGLGLGLRPACPECGHSTTSEEVFLFFFFSADKVFHTVPVAVCTMLPV